MTSSSPDYPEYQFVPTTVTANGETLARQYKDAFGNVVTDVSLPKESLARKNKLQNLLNQYEDSINIFSPELTSQMESIANAKKKSALDDFQAIYEPAARSAREDYFARLGTLDSTAYMDRYNALEGTRAKAYADIENDYIANLDTLKNNELSQRYAYLNYLQNGLNSINNLNNSYLNTINSLSSNYTNNYNNYLGRMYSNQTNNNTFDWLGSATDIAGAATSLFSMFI